MRKLRFAPLLLVLAALSTMIPWFGARRTKGHVSEIGVAPPYTFPPDFLWGTATADHQVESSQNDDWSAFEREAVAQGHSGSLGPGRALPGHIRDLVAYPEEVRRNKTNYDALFPEDLAMAAAMKHNAYRFSISWARLFPTEAQTEPSAEGLAFYGRVLAVLRQHHMTPSVTLFHFASPAWLWEERGGQRGWERQDALQHFERFVRAVVDHFGGDIGHWCTLNEPMVYIYNGYLEGVFPPRERRGDPSQVTGVLSQLLKAHALAYRIIKEDAGRRGKQALVGYTQHTRQFEPYRNWAPLDRVTAGVIEQAFIWDLPDAVQSGVLKVTNTSYREEIPGLRGTQDYLGINYYGRFYVKTDLLHPLGFQVLPHDPAGEREINDLGWAAYPRGFFLVLMKAHEKYHLPIYVLENGTADRLGQRAAEFLSQHVREMWYARHRGADVRGYFYWSLIDNFEWAEGFEGRFGLVEVDYAHGYRRTPRPSAAVYSRIIQDHGILAGPH